MTPEQPDREEFLDLAAMTWQILTAGFPQEPLEPAPECDVYRRLKALADEAEKLAEGM